MTDPISGATQAPPQQTPSPVRPQREEAAQTPAEARPEQAEPRPQQRAEAPQEAQSQDSRSRDPEARVGSQIDIQA